MRLIEREREKDIPVYRVGENLLLVVMQYGMHVQLTGSSAANAANS